MDKISVTDALNQFAPTQDQIDSAYGEFVSLTNRKTVRYLNTQANCDALRDFLVKNAGVDSLSFSGAWSEAWMNCSASGVLEEPLTDEEKNLKARERAQILEARDRREGLNPRKSEAEIEAERQEEIARRKKEAEERKALPQKMREAAEARAKAEQAENDMSVVPSVEAIQANPDLLAPASVAQSELCRRLSTVQLRRFIKNQLLARQLETAKRGKR